MNVQRIDFSFLSVQKSKFWLKRTLHEKVAKTTKNKTVCSSVIYKYRLLYSLSSGEDTVQNL